MFAAMAPERTRSLVCVGTALNLFPSDDPHTAIVQDCIAILEREGAEAAFDKRPSEVEVAFGELWSHCEALATNNLEEYRRCQQHWRTMAERFSREERIHCYATELRSIQAHMLAEVAGYARYAQAPTYILHGSNDRIILLKNAKAITQAIPSAHFDVIPGGGHNFFSESADARRRVMDFMRSVDTKE